MTNDPAQRGSSSPASDPGGQPKVDETIQIKFTIIFGLLAIIPFVLFYYYGLEIKPDAPAATGIAETNASIPRAFFKDITSEAGINFTHFNGAEGEKLLPETMGGGCAFFDFDNDGDQDLFFVNSASWPWSNKPKPAQHAIYENDGKGNFRDVTAGSGLDFSSYGMGVATGDFNSDGKVDLLITGVGRNYLMVNDGNGKFRDLTEAAGIRPQPNEWSTSAAFFDYDRDGDLDLFICHYVQWSREIDLRVDYRLPGAGRAYGPPMSFAGAFPTLYRNDGQGKFTDVSAEAGVQIKNNATGLPLAKSLGVSPVDLDNDGWIDLVVANDTVQNFVFHNNKNGTFTETGGQTGLAYDKFGSTRGAMGIDTGRFQDDNTLAISIGNFANEMTAFYMAKKDPLVFTDEALNVGIGDPTRGLLTFGVFFFDYDLDGNLDLLTANGHIEPEIQKVHPEQTYRQPAQLFWNGGKKPGQTSFHLAPPDKSGPDLYEPLAGRGSAYADIDGDSDLDVVITQVGAPAKLLRNEQNLGRHWTRISLRDKPGNLNALGATIRLRSGSRSMVRQVNPARGYLSQSELPVVFGLGVGERIDQAEVTWTDGTKQALPSLKIDTLNFVTRQ